MAVKKIPILFPGHTTAGSFVISALLTYDSAKNVTVVSDANVVFSTNAQGYFSSVSANVSFTPADNPSEARLASMRETNIFKTEVTGQLSPTPLMLPHLGEGTAKQVKIGISYNYRATIAPSIVSNSGYSEFVVPVDLVSIIHVGELTGSLYVAIDGKWHLGVIHAADGGKFYPSVGYILSAPEKGIEVAYDDAGNVVISGVRVTHDEQGNVSLIGATVEDDGDGHITIK